ncbi:MAG: hypothetical protein LBE56_05515 [Tannerella sp.]|jgi:hypothetical protein|nr:hypothetical protein [Tannerella sp.]
MEAVVTKQPFNDAQLFVIRSFASVKTDGDREELTSLYLDFLQRKLDAETNRLWQEGKLSDSIFEEMLHTHIRTPYDK